ncbi:collagen alpha-1(I) chain-like [Talpa occidentalis]|uniref:collagen alpha-1(I) chain-like n=1 Tax=Talpa occidentalis TaxID=50954 RepID=UPI00188F78F0|nr:collagen alpha-1(I) chain-like [Talpa occidentalis]
MHILILVKPLAQTETARSFCAVPRAQTTSPREAMSQGRRGGTDRSLAPQHPRPLPAACPKVRWGASPWLHDTLPGPGGQRRQKLGEPAAQPDPQLLHRALPPRPALSNPFSGTPRRRTRRPGPAGDVPGFPARRAAGGGVGWSRGTFRKIEEMGRLSPQHRSPRAHLRPEPRGKRAPASPGRAASPGAAQVGAAGRSARPEFGAQGREGEGDRAPGGPRGARREGKRRGGGPQPPRRGGAPTRRRQVWSGHRGGETENLRPSSRRPRQDAAPLRRPRRPAARPPPAPQRARPARWLPLRGRRGAAAADTLARLSCVRRGAGARRAGAEPAIYRPEPGSAPGTPSPRARGAGRGRGPRLRGSPGQRRALRSGSGSGSAARRPRCPRGALRGQDSAGGAGAAQAPQDTGHQAAFGKAGPNGAILLQLRAIPSALPRLTRTSPAALPGEACDSIFKERRLRHRGPSLRDPATGGGTGKLGKLALTTISLPRALPPTRPCAVAPRETGQPHPTYPRGQGGSSPQSARARDAPPATGEVTAAPRAEPAARVERKLLRRAGGHGPGAGTQGPAGAGARGPGAGTQDPPVPVPAALALGLRDPQVQVPAALALGLRDPPVQVATALALGLRDPQLQVPAALALGLSDPQVQVPTALALELRDPQVPVPAALALGLRDPPVQVPTALALDLRDPQVPVPTALALDLRDPQVPVPTALELGLRDPQVPVPTALALGLRDPQVPVPAALALDSGTRRCRCPRPWRWDSGTRRCRCPRPWRWDSGTRRGRCPRPWDLPAPPWRCPAAGTDGAGPSALSARASRERGDTGADTDSPPGSERPEQGRGRPRAGFAFVLFLVISRDWTVAGLSQRGPLRRW